MAAGDFWDNREVADKTVAELSACKAVLEPYKKLSTMSDDFAALESWRKRMLTTRPCWRKLTKHGRTWQRNSIVLS